MKTIKAIIVDDEKNAQIVLDTLIRKLDLNVEIVGYADDIINAKTLIDELQPQLVFLDIRMPGGSAFELLKSFPKPVFKIIFVTSHHEYAINAIKINALDYLLKPVDMIELRASLEKVTEVINLHEYQKKVNNLINHFGHDEIKKIPVHVNQQVILLAENEIVLCTSDGNYTVITTPDKRKYTVVKNLKEVELYFSSDQLLRVRRDVLINTKFVKSYTKNEPCFIELVGDIRIEVSRRKRSEVLSLLKQSTGL